MPLIMEKIHDRMPLILERDQVRNRHLDDNATDSILKQTAYFSATGTTAGAVNVLAVGMLDEAEVKDRIAGLGF